MRVDNVPRVMWLLNHTSARKFEVPMLKSIGLTEIFLPKSYPNDPNFRSASVDWSEDQNLSIPEEDLAILNQADWYRGATRQAWDIANKYFDFVFFIVVDPRCAENIAKYFKGAALWRTYGLSGKGNSYSRIMQVEHYYRGVLSSLESMGTRFWFAEAYDHLHAVEKNSVASRAIYIPLGMKGAENAISDDWTGSDERILFVCPDIGFNYIYADIYKEFKKDFKGFPYAIGGSQAVAIDDPKILGFLPLEEHQRNMREMRVMYYHSTEPRHIHFHPFEAIRAGMPLVFRGGGILDKMGGRKMPGRCGSTREAKRKIQRILSGDKHLIDSIRSTQGELLEGMMADNLREHWISAFAKISATLAETRRDHRSLSVEHNRVAILTSSYDAELSLDMAKKLVQQAFDESGRTIEVVLGVTGMTPGRKAKLEQDAVGGVSVRHCRWRKIRRTEGERSLLYKGNARKLSVEEYLVPEDGSNDFFDCGLWIARIAGAGLKTPVLPLRPIIISVTKLGHRFLPHGVGPFTYGPFGLEIPPELVLVDSEFAFGEMTRNEGVPKRLVRMVAAPEPLPYSPRSREPLNSPYFAWVMERGGALDPDKAVHSLVAYYEEYGGTLNSKIVLGENFNRDDYDFWKKCLRQNPSLVSRTQVKMLETDEAVLDYSSQAEFLWRPSILGDDRLIRKLIKAGVRILAAECPVLSERTNTSDSVSWATYSTASSMGKFLVEGEREDANIYAVHAGGNSTAAVSYWKAVSECL